MVKPVGRNQNGENVKRDRAGNRYDWQNGETVKRAKTAELVYGKTAKPEGSVNGEMVNRQGRELIRMVNGKN